MFTIKDSGLLYTQTVFVLQKAGSAYLQIAHDSKIGGHFNFAKTLTELHNFHCGELAWVVDKNKDWYIKCRKYKHSNTESFTSPETVEMSEQK